MAAAIPQATGNRGAIFAIAYVVCRMLAVLTWRRTGTIMTAWPAAQVGAGFLPWLISIWTEPPTRYWLWGIGIRWVLCGGMALYFLTTMTIGALTKAPRRWLAGWAAPAVVLPLLLGAFGGALPSWSLAVGLLAATAWQTAYPRLGAARSQPA